MPDNIYLLAVPIAFFMLVLGLPIPFHTVLALRT